MAVAAALGLSLAAAQIVRLPDLDRGHLYAPVHPFPRGELEPNGARVVWDLMNIFRFDHRGRLVEEFVRTDNRGFLRQLGAEVA